MIRDIDIWRAATLLLKQHGADAAMEAARKADLMLERGDRDGQITGWARLSVSPASALSACVAAYLRENG